MSNFEELTTTQKLNGHVVSKSKKRIIRKILISLLVSLVVLGVVISLFINIHPAFGGNPSKEQKEVYNTFDNYDNGKFVYRASTKMNGSASNSPSTFEDSNSGGKERNPAGQIPVSEIDWNKINSKDDSLSWFGHSAFLLSIDNKKILLDPMLGPIASPVSFVGPKRFSEDMLDMIEEMPPIDAVFITHDHYDHLDYQSIKKLNSKVGHFFVPYGVSNHLIRWGVAKKKLQNLIGGMKLSSRV